MSMEYREFNEIELAEQFMVELQNDEGLKTGDFKCLLCPDRVLSGQALLADHITSKRHLQRLGIHRVSPGQFGLPLRARPDELLFEYLRRYGATTAKTSCSFSTMTAAPTSFTPPTPPKVFFYTPSSSTNSNSSVENRRTEKAQTTGRSSTSYSFSQKDLDKEMQRTHLRKQWGNSLQFCFTSFSFDNPWDGSYCASCAICNPKNNWTFYTSSRNSLSQVNNFTGRSNWTNWTRESNWSRWPTRNSWKNWEKHSENEKTEKFKGEDFQRNFESEKFDDSNLAKEVDDEKSEKSSKREETLKVLKKFERKIPKGFEGVETVENFDNFFEIRASSPKADDIESQKAPDDNDEAADDRNESESESENSELIF